MTYGTARRPESCSVYISLRLDDGGVGETEMEMQRGYVGRYDMKRHDVPASAENSATQSAAHGRAAHPQWRPSRNRRRRHRGGSRASSCRFHLPALALSLSLSPHPSLPIPHSLNPHPSPHSPGCANVQMTACGSLARDVPSRNLRSAARVSGLIVYSRLSDDCAVAPALAPACRVCVCVGVRTCHGGCAAGEGGDVGA